MALLLWRAVVFSPVSVGALEADDVTTPPRTPAGARLQIRRTKLWAHIDIDRWPITDATIFQAAAVHQLARAASVLLYARGYRKWSTICSGKVNWMFTVPRDQETSTLTALLAIEAGDLEPARLLAAEWTVAPAGTTP